MRIRDLYALVDQMDVVNTDHQGVNTKYRKTLDKLRESLTDIDK